MFESFVIMLREGIEAALVIGIMLVVINRTQRKDLKRPVFWGLGLALLASIGMAFILKRLPINEETYEGTLYWVAAIFVGTMMLWMYKTAKTFRKQIEQRIVQTVEATTSQRNLKEVWGLGLFAFLMIFREGAEVVMFLGAIQLNTEALLSFLGTLLGLVLTVIFCVMFVRGNLKVDLAKFFVVTQWILGIFIVQLIVNGYHEFSEVGLLPATQKSMALVGPIVRHSTLFIIALVALPLFVWLGKKPQEEFAFHNLSEVQLRLAQSRMRVERAYRKGAIFATLLVLVFVGVVYAKEVMPRSLPAPESVTLLEGKIVVPRAKLEEGKLYRFGLLHEGRLMRFLVMKTTDGKYRTAFDACKICGAFGYIQDNKNLLCLNCLAEINPFSVGHGGGCNPIPLENQLSQEELSISLTELEKGMEYFTATSGLEEIDPVCGMRIKVHEASAFETYNDRIYYFCRMPKCQNAFKENPQEFIR